MATYMQEQANALNKWRAWKDEQGITEKETEFNALPFTIANFEEKEKLARISGKKAASFGWKRGTGVINKNMLVALRFGWYANTFEEMERYYMNGGK